MDATTVHYQLVAYGDDDLMVKEIDLPHVDQSTVRRLYDLPVDDWAGYCYDVTPRQQPYLEGTGIYLDPRYSYCIEGYSKNLGG